MKKLLLAMVLFAIIASPAIAFADDGCYGAGSCVSRSAKWSGNGRITTSYTNECQGRIYIRVCNERANGQSADCGASGLRPGRTFKWTTNSNATGRYNAKWIGSEKSGKDWVCKSKADGWDDPMF